MNRKLLLVAFLSTFALTILAAGHQLTNAAPNMAPPPQHAPPIALMTTAVTPTWQVVAGGGGTANYLADVSMGSPTDGWVVGSTGPGSYGVLMHYDGAAWNRTSTPTGTYNLNAVAMISPTEGWAVGYNPCSYGTCDSGLLMHYTQTGWQRATLPPHPVSYDDYSGFVDIDIKGTAGWIVGGTPYYLQLSGSNWTSVTAPLPYAYAVSVVNAGEAWAVGYNWYYLLSTSNIAHWTGGAWSLVTPTYNLPPNYRPILHGVDVLDGGEGWAVGFSRYSPAQTQCLLVHYAAGAWTQIPCLSSAASLNGVAMRNPNDVWAVGYLGNSSRSGAGVIYHFNGSTWMTATTPSGTPSLYSVELVGANDGWIVGSSGTILRIVNGTWTRVQGPSLYVGPIDAVNANEVWYGGPAGQLYRWQNGTTTQFTGPLTTSISVLDMVTPTLGWGYSTSPGYRLFRYSNGTWTVWPRDFPVYDIDMISPNEGWIGDYFDLWHYTSETFNKESLPYSDGPRSLSMLDSNHGWAVGAHYSSPREIYTYTAGTWAAVTPAPTFSGYWVLGLQVIGISPGEAWLAGCSESCTAEECPVSAELHHFAGGAWTSIPLPDWRALLDISKVGATEWWAAGILQTGEHAFLHYKDGVFTTVPGAGEDVQQVSILPDGSGFASGVGSVLRLIDLPIKVYLPIARR